METLLRPLAVVLMFTLLVVALAIVGLRVTTSLVHRHRPATAPSEGVRS